MRPRGSDAVYRIGSTAACGRADCPKAGRPGIIVGDVPREGLPTVRIRTLDHAGNPTGEVLLDPDAARLVPGNVEVALEGLGTVIDATGGVSHGGLARFGTEDGWVEIGWVPDGTFESFGRTTDL